MAVNNRLTVRDTRFTTNLIARDHVKLCLHLHALDHRCHGQATISRDKSVLMTFPDRRQEHLV
jgi:hypothetical protein